MGFEQFIEKTCVQTAVYWGNPTADGYGGQTYDDPIEISSRWEIKREVVQADNGEEIISEVSVFVLQDLVSNSVLYLGDSSGFTEESWNNPGSWDDAKIQIETPDAINTVYRIVKVEKIPILKSTTKFVRKVYLQ